MPRQTYVYDRATRKLVPKVKPSTPRGPQIINSACEPFRSMADGKIYTDKAKYRAEIKARGFQEIGNERPLPSGPRTDPGDREYDIRKTISELNS